MEQPHFEQYEPMDSYLRDSLARIYMIKNFPDSPVEISLSDKEEDALEQWLAVAPSHHVEEVKKHALFLRKYFTYIDTISSEDEEAIKEKEAIEEEMEKDPELRQYIESSYAEGLAEKYSVWRYGVDNTKGDPDAQVFEMTDDEIFAFFDLLDKYPTEIDHMLSAMTSEISPNPDSGPQFVIRPNEGRYISEREKLLQLRDYFTGKMSAEDQNDFANEIIDNPDFRSMFVKIQNALK